MTQKLKDNRLLTIEAKPSDLSPLSLSLSLDALDIRAKPLPSSLVAALKGREEREGDEIEKEKAKEKRERRENPDALLTSTDLLLLPRNHLLVINLHYASFLLPPPCYPQPPPSLERKRDRVACFPGSR